MRENCFICLEKTSNKVCKQCNCYAHTSCWGRYMKENGVCELVEEEDCLMLLTKNFIPCPLCRDENYCVPVTTRSKTEAYRFHTNFLFAHDYYMKFKNLDLSKNLRFKYLDMSFKYFKNLKQFIIENEAMTQCIKIILSDTYHIDRWNNANYYHMEFFGEQIEKII